ESAAALSPGAMSALGEKTRASCAACTIGCEHIFHHSSSERGVRMEYENLFALGPLCGIADAEVVLQASALCDELGIDTISSRSTFPPPTIECTSAPTQCRWRSTRRTKPR